MVYTQEKLTSKTNLKSTCHLEVDINEESIMYRGSFYSEFKRSSILYDVTFIHELRLDKKTGDVYITYEIINEKNVELLYKTNLWLKKNNFEKLFGLTSMGFYRGEKSSNFWGVKYKNATNEMFNKIKDDLQPEFKTNFFKHKEYNSLMTNNLFELIVDYHLFKKNIKGHDGVYTQIQNIYPKKNWLKLNDNKFLPSILDEYGIKSKYLVKELSKQDEYYIKIKTVIYLCNIFGENYIDYIKKIDWKKISSLYFNRIKKHKCKTEFEKNVIVNLLNSEVPITYVPINQIYDLFELRNFLESKGYKKLKIKVKNLIDATTLIEYWTMLKKQINKGYSVRYKIPKKIVEDIETPININNEIFYPKILTSVNDFHSEGFKMKNCMGKRFIMGSIHMYISLTNNKQRINIQYRCGVFIVAYGKANSDVPVDIFEESLKELNKKMLKYKTLSWETEKFEIK